MGDIHRAYFSFLCAFIFAETEIAESLFTITETTKFSILTRQVRMKFNGGRFQLDRADGMTREN